jgi:hypothetical protein
MHPKPLYIVGECRDEPNAWDFVGVFESAELAEAACTSPRYFVGPAVLNERTPDGSIAWPGAWFPIPPDTQP